MRRFLVIISGLIFGCGLALSRMTNPNRVLGFLDVAGNWDPTLCFVMGGAVAIFAMGYWVLRHLNSTRTKVPRPDSGPISVSLLAGAAIFGVGWGWVGLCPGPALANLGALRIEALIFVPAMALGAILAQRFFGADSDR